MSDAMKIEEFVRETEALSEDDFLEAYPFPFLLHESTGASIPIPKANRATTRLKAAAVPEGGGFMQGDALVYPVCPADPDNFDGAVRLGRDTACDIVINDGSISTEHAHFTLEFEGEDRFVMVSDVGSSNGTFLNGERLEERSPTRLSDQDSLRFGPAVKLQYFEGEGLFQLLGFYRQMKG